MGNKNDTTIFYWLLSGLCYRDNGKRGTIKRTFIKLKAWVHKCYGNIYKAFEKIVIVIININKKIYLTPSQFNLHNRYL